jgi:hypothetical protein
MTHASINATTLFIVSTPLFYNVINKLGLFRNKKKSPTQRAGDRELY